MSMLPIQALSIRMWATMFPPSSATAIFIGCPISLAFFSAALITRRASSSITADIDSSLQLFEDVVRRPEVRELVHQVTVRPNHVCHVSVRVYREEKIDNVIGQRPAILRKARRLVRMIGKNIWQQLSCDGLCVLRSIAARVFQLVREHADEAIIIRRLPAEVSLPLLSNEENRLQWSGTPVCLDPAFPNFVHRASPDPHFIAFQIRVGQFNHDAANIFVDEEVVPGELHVIEIADYVQKERIAAPAEEKTEVADFRHQGFSSD